MPTAEATAVAAASRLLLVAVDGLGGMAGLLYAQSSSRRMSPPPGPSRTHLPGGDALHKHDVSNRAKNAYVASARATGLVLTKIGLLSPEAPARDRRLRHWAHSLTKVHDPTAMADLDVPWWTYRAIDIVDQWLEGHAHPIRVFEYGSGASTVWLARRADEVHSVEHDVAFAAKIGPMLEQYGNITLHVTEPKMSSTPTVPSAKNGYAGLDFSDYVATISAVSGSFDLVVIDGRAREACLAAALPRLAPDGIIVYDNTHRARYRRAIAATGVSEQRLRGLTPTLPYPDQTSVLRAK